MLLYEAKSYFADDQQHFIRCVTKKSQNSIQQGPNRNRVSYRRQNLHIQFV